MKAAALLAVVLLSACGGAQTPVAGKSSPSPMQTASPSPTATPVLGACDASHRCLALVTLRGNEFVVVRDITDIGNPRTIASWGPPLRGFVNANELFYVTDGRIFTSGLLVGSGEAQVSGAAKGAGTAAWSPDGMSVVYTTERGSVETGDEELDVHLLRGGVDRVVGTTPGMGVGGCEYIASCTLPNWLDARLAFSPDGTSFSFVAQGFGSTFFRVWSSDGTLLKSSDAQFSTMSAWSGQTLYYAGPTGVEAWHDGVISTFLPRVAWIKPSASPAGGKIVYTVRGAGGWGHIYVVDTATGKAREIKAQRTDALFLTPRYIWYRGERACVASDICGPTPPFHPESGKTYIYDLKTGVEYGSVITSVGDVWPHAA
jgi:hypothetical protein